MPTIETFSQYREWLRTKVRPGLTFEGELQNATLGLVGESLEVLAERNGESLLREYGDVVFYAEWLDGLCLAHFGMDDRKDDLIAEYEDHVGRGPVAWNAVLCTCVGPIAEHMKKFIYHDKEFCPGIVAYWVDGVLRFVHRNAVIEGSSLSDVIDRNVSKLDARYPHGFVVGGGIRD